MESKKSMLALMEDESGGPGVASLLPTSSSCSAESGDAAVLAGPQQQLSCVTRETSQEDCARHRFIVWAAVKRNGSVRMPPEKKLECPLLRCPHRSPDHESMLRHLAGCTYLASGEYWCYDHMNIERFDDLKCKRCLGHPSKRKKVLAMAKTFFHSLGHKAKKGHSSRLDADYTFMPPPPYDYGSGLSNHLDDTNPTELSSNEILEIDSTEVNTIQNVAATASEGVIDPQALLALDNVPSLPELDSTVLSCDMSWQSPPILMPPSYLANPTNFYDEFEAQNSGSKPFLQVNTHGLTNRRHTPRPPPRPVSVVSRSKGLSPSSSVRSNASTDSNGSSTSNSSSDTNASADTTFSNVSSLVSPSSHYSAVWSMASGANTSMTSPVEEFMTDDPFADAVYGGSCPEFLHDFYSELPADPPLSKTMEDSSAQPFLSFDAPQLSSVFYATNVDLAEDLADEIDVDTDEAEVEESNVCCSETKSIVGSAWDALQEHIVSSTLKIQTAHSNLFANQLRLMSTNTIATTGLRTLRNILDGGQPSSAIESLCFVHLVYAFSLVVHGQQGALSRSKGFFLQSLSFANCLPHQDREAYTQLVFAIWQPSDIDQRDVDMHLATSHSNPPSRSSSVKGKSPAVRGYESNPLLSAARDFLDDLESTLVVGQDPASLELQTSGLYNKHIQELASTVPVNEALAVTVNYVLSTLAQDFGNVGSLGNKLSEISQRVSHGTISSVRRVEVELFHAGKERLDDSMFFNDYAPGVRNLCDKIYERHDAGASRRNDYHSLGITLIENILPEFDKPTGDIPAPLFEDDLDEFFDKMHTDCGNDTTSPFADLGPTGFQPLANPFEMPTFTQKPAFTEEQQQATPPPPPSSSRESSESSESSDQQQGGGLKVEAQAGCELCGYRPKGSPQWFKGSMAKHMKLQHSQEPPKIFKCPFPGCTSQYKNRADNLRQHQIEKNHFVEGEEMTTRRPSKRKKVAADE